MEHAKVGDKVWYVVCNDRAQAEIVKIEGSTHVTIRILDGPMMGTVLEAPWGIVQRHE